LGTTRLRGRARNRWQDELREDRRILGGEGWQEKVHNREEWKKLLRMAGNHRILHMPMEWMNKHKMFAIYICQYTALLATLCNSFLLSASLSEFSFLILIQKKWWYNIIVIKYHLMVC
jgi:hypothetical protein